MPVEFSHPVLVLYEKSTSKTPLFSFILLISAIVKDPLPLTLSPTFNDSESAPITTSSPSVDLMTSKSFSILLTFNFSPDVNGAESKTTSKVGYCFLGITLPSPFDRVTAIPVLVVNPTTSNSTLNGFGFGFAKGSGIDFTLKNLYP